jgi:hypothetical protein
MPTFSRRFLLGLVSINYAVDQLWFYDKHTIEVRVMWIKYKWELHTSAIYENLPEIEI